MNVVGKLVAFLAGMSALGVLLEPSYAYGEGIRYEVKEDLPLAISPFDEAQWTNVGEEMLCGEYQKEAVRCYRVEEEITDAPPDVPPELLKYTYYVFKPPYPAPLPTLDSNGLLTECCANDGYSEKLLGKPKDYPKVSYGWALSNEVVEGLAIAKEWGYLADKGATFDCSQDRCTKLVRAWPSGSPEVSAIALCEVAINKDAVGPPEECTFVEYARDGEVWLVAAVGLSTTFATASAKYADVSIVVQSKESREEIVRTTKPAVRSRIEEKPLVLAVSENASGLVGTASYRYSNDFGLWMHETLRVYWGTSRTSEDTVIDASTTLYVSSQNSANPTDWHMPTDPQGAMYQQRVLDTLKSALLSVCPSGSWVPSSGQFIFDCRQ